jgi:uroporphyrinogen-III decarboxylase
MSDAQSNTPRTDFQTKRYYDDAKGERVEYIPSRFARQLERELNQRNAEIKAWKNKWECAVEMAAQAHLKADDYEAALMAIDEIYIDGSDIESDYEAMGEIASKALTEDEE